VAVNCLLQQKVEQFLFHEARLLDDRLFDQWLDLFTEDCRYWMPVRQTTMRSANELRGDDELPLFDDDKKFLTARVYRLTRTPLAHAEKPPSRTRHFVSNVSVVERENGVLDIISNILVYQSRLERTESTFVGCRQDTLRPVDDSWRIAVRKIILDQTLIPRTLSIFF
jgi:3-phenylpropionate/cinnamic acid dioxygenase small subunit